MHFNVVRDVGDQPLRMQAWLIRQVANDDAQALFETLLPRIWDLRAGLRTGLSPKRVVDGVVAPEPSQRPALLSQGVFLEPCDGLC